MILAVFMDHFVMSLKPQVKTLIKHHANLSLNIFPQTSQPRLQQASQGVDTITHAPVHYNAIQRNSVTIKLS